MMAYLMDSNGYIQAKNQYYGMDFCPAYWDWLSAASQSGLVISIDRVYAEIQWWQDDLSRWVAQPAIRGMFLPSDDADTMAELPRVFAWAQARLGDQGRPFYGPHAINEFLADPADPYLIAYASVHNHTIVTCESDNPANRIKVLIPVVCNGLGVNWLTPFDMLRREQVRFVLP